MIQWEKIGRWIKNGETVNAYQGVGTELRILSVKRQIPHANGRGTWAHTFFEIFRDGEKVCDAHSLTRAKELAEELAAGAET